MSQPYIDYVLAQDLESLRLSQPDLLMVDVRDEPAFDEMALPGTYCMPLADLENGSLEAELKDDSRRPILFICAKGGRATTAADTLRDLLENPMSVLLGGILACAQAGLPLKQGKS